MRKLLLFFLIASPAFGQQVYRTNFPTTENPLSQNSNWRDGAINGANGNVRTQAVVPGGVNAYTSSKGWAYGTTNTFSCPPTGCNDSLAVVTGVTWGSNQMACATVHLNTAGFTRNAHLYESEIRLNTTLAAGGTNSGYEFQFSTHDGSGSPYVGIVRLNGTTDNFTQLNSLPPTTVMTQGQLFCATHLASGALQAYIDGVPQFTGSNARSDTTYLGGSPGIGFFNGGGAIADNVNFGWEDFWARDSFVFAASCTETDVATAVNAAGTVDGTAVIVPNSTCASWNTHLNTTKQIGLLGMSHMGVNVVIKDAFVTTGADHLLNFTTGNSFNTEVAYLSFFQDSTACPSGSGTGTSGCAGFIGFTGTGLPPLIHDAVEDHQNFATFQSSASNPISMNNKGGVFYNMSFQCEDYTGSAGGCDGGSLGLKPGNWDQVSTEGAKDTNEATNVYVEDSTVSYMGQFPDVDSGGAFTSRYTHYINSDGLTHGATSGSGGGGRLLEFYNDYFQYQQCPPGQTCTCGESPGNPPPHTRVISGWFWWRSGTGVVHDVQFDSPNSGGCSGTGGLAAFVAENITNGAGGLACCVGYHCWDQPGSSSAGAGNIQSPSNTPPTANSATGALQPNIGTDNTLILDPIYFWNMSGTGAGGSITAGRGDSIPNQCATSAIAALGGPFTSPSFIHQNRDFFVNAGPKPGYAPGAYPHPSRNSFNFAPVTAPATNYNPTPMAFGNVTVGSPSTQTLTITNVGTATLVVTGNALGDTSVWSKNSSTCAPSPNVAPGGTCTIGITFTPTAAGLKSTTLSVNSNAASSPDVINLSGTGVSSVQPGININPASKNYGSLVVGSNSSQVFTITSTTTSALLMGNPPATITGTNAGDFTLTPGCTAGQSLSQGQTCSESVLFSPSAIGSRTAQLNIFDNAAGSPQIVALSGTGATPTASVSPVSLPFNNVVVNQTLTLPVTLQNTGTAPLTISSIVQTGTGFTQTNNCGASLGAGLSCTIQVTLAPLATGTMSGTLTITDNSSTGSTQTVPSSGSGILVPTTVQGVTLGGVVIQ